MEDTKTDNEAMIQQMIAEAESAPSTTSVEDKVVHKGDEGQPAPMVISEISGDDHAWIYDRKTGERSKANRNMLAYLLKLKNRDGTTRFTAIKPPFSPPRGSLKCYLHPEDSNREHYNELGFPVCNKSNITNPYQVRRHMMKKHGEIWEAIEQERVDREKKEDRDFQRTMLEGMKGAAEKAPLYVSDKDKKQGA